MSCIIYVESEISKYYQEECELFCYGLLCFFSNLMDYLKKNPVTLDYSFI
jgi:hypothetical protein